MKPPLKKRKAITSVVEAVQCPNPKQHEVDLKSFDSAVTLVVRETGEELVFHKTHLCRIAPYFEAALNGSFIEAAEQKIWMVDEDGKILHLFQVWAYTGRLLLDNDSNDEYTLWTLAVRTYIFAESRGISLLQDHIIDILAAKIKWTDPNLRQLLPHLVYQVYDNTSENSLMRKFFVALARDCPRSDEDLFPEGSADEYPKEFFRDLSKSFMSSRDSEIKRRSPEESTCEFHLHPFGTEENGAEELVQLCS